MANLYDPYLNPMSVGPQQFYFPSGSGFNPLQTQPAQIYTQSGGYSAPPAGIRPTGLVAPSSLIPGAPQVVTGGQPQGYALPSDNTDWNSIYGPIFENLNQQEALEEPMYQGQIASIKGQGETAKGNIALKQQQGETTLAGQETAASEGKENALQQARQLYNELAQYNQARFGSGSSAGPAAMELLGRSTQEQMGNAQVAYTNQKAQIDQSRNQLNQFALQYTKEIDQSVNDKMLEAQRDYFGRLTMIRNNRAMAESDKAAQKAQVAQNFNAFVQQLISQREQVKLELSVWNAEQNASLNKQLATMPTETDMTGFWNKVNPVAQNIYNSSATRSPGQTIQPTTSLAYGKSSLFKQPIYDEYGRIIGYS